jgi:1-phosphofructokinase family hexose kinase
MRPDRFIDKVGGKALDASVALRTFGVETVALSFVAGNAGQRLVKLLDGYGIRHHLIWLEGETRISHVLIETEHRRHSHITAGTLAVPPEAATALLDRYRTHVHHADWVIAGGSLPPGVPTTYYQTIITIAAAAGVPVLIDSFGPPVKASLTTPPAILKMNWTEFCQTFDLQADSLDQLQRQAGTVFERKKLPALVITCGKQGIMALTPDGPYLATSPAQPVVNAAGAGDATSAALAWRLGLGDSWPDTLRWAAAAGAAVVLTEGTADCHLADVERIWAETTVQPLEVQ